ncbi:hypothetical protein HK099_006210, partial [Clydaea vesicula]
AANNPHQNLKKAILIRRQRGNDVSSDNLGNPSQDPPKVEEPEPSPEPPKPTTDLSTPTNPEPTVSPKPEPTIDPTKTSLSPTIAPPNTNPSTTSTQLASPTIPRTTKSKPHTSSAPTNPIVNPSSSSANSIIASLSNSLFVTDPTTTFSPGLNNSSAADDFTGEKTNGLSTASVWAIATVAVCVVGAVIGIWIFRKWKLRPSDKFAIRMRTNPFKKNNNNLSSDRVTVSTYNGDNTTNNNYQNSEWGGYQNSDRGGVNTVLASNGYQRSECGYSDMQNNFQLNNNQVPMNYVPINYYNPTTHSNYNNNSYNGY